MLFPENFFHSREKYRVSGKFFWYVRKNVVLFRKNVIYPENFLVCSENFFEMISPPPRRQHYREKILDALFFRKVPLKAWLPQLLDASYAPAFTSCSNWQAALNDIIIRFANRHNRKLRLN